MKRNYVGHSPISYFGKCRKTKHFQHLQKGNRSKKTQEKCNQSLEHRPDGNSSGKTYFLQDIFKLKLIINFIKHMKRNHVSPLSMFPPFRGWERISSYRYGSPEKSSEEARRAGDDGGV